MLLTSGGGLGTLSHMASEGLALSQAQTLSSDVKTCMILVLWYVHCPYDMDMLPVLPRSLWYDVHFQLLLCYLANIFIHFSLIHCCHYYDVLSMKMILSSLCYDMLNCQLIPQLPLRYGVNASTVIILWLLPLPILSQPLKICCQCYKICCPCHSSARNARCWPVSRHQPP